MSPGIYIEDEFKAAFRGKRVLFTLAGLRDEVRACSPFLLVKFAVLSGIDAVARGESILIFRVLSYWLQLGERFYFLDAAREADIERWCGLFKWIAAGL